MQDIYKQVTWNWDKDLLNYRITIDWLRDIEKFINNFIEREQ